MDIKIHKILRILKIISLWQLVGVSEMRLLEPPKKFEKKNYLKNIIFKAIKIAVSWKGMLTLNGNCKDHDQTNLAFHDNSQPISAEKLGS